MVVRTATASESRNAFGSSGSGSTTGALMPQTSHSMTLVALRCVSNTTRSSVSRTAVVVTGVKVASTIGCDPTGFVVFSTGSG